MKLSKQKTNKGWLDRFYDQWIYEYKVQLVVECFSPELKGIGWARDSYLKIISTYMVLKTWQWMESPRDAKREYSY